MLNEHNPRVFKFIDKQICVLFDVEYKNIRIYIVMYPLSILSVRLQITIIENNNIISNMVK